MTTETKNAWAGAAASADTGFAEAARRLGLTPAGVGKNVARLESNLGVRLFQRTTRALSPTEQGKAFYPGATAVLEALDEAEAQVSSITENPKGHLHVSAPLGVGRRLIAPLVPEFLEQYPEISVRLRLTDRNVDLTAEGLDIAFFLGKPEDSNLRIRNIADCKRVLCAAPEYLEKHGNPASAAELLSENHECLNLRFPGAAEFQWRLQTEEGPKKFPVKGRLECDDGDVLTDWALSGRGIALKPVFEVAEHLATGQLVGTCAENPPEDIQMACLFTHRRRQDPKTRLFMEFMIEAIGGAVKSAEKSAAI